MSELTRECLQMNVYIDDGLGCANSPDEAIQILSEARKALSKFNIRIHKILSNSPKVLAAFPASKRAPNLDLMNFGDVPTQYALGIAWDIVQDRFVIQTSIPTRAFTKQGILAAVNSIFDLTGVTSPVSLGAQFLWDHISYYSDSQVVLGYIRNSERRFKRYISQRVQLITKCAPPDIWQYISLTRLIWLLDHNTQQRWLAAVGYLDLSSCGLRAEKPHVRKMTMLTCWRCYLRKNFQKPRLWRQMWTNKPESGESSSQGWVVGLKYKT